MPAAPRMVLILSENDTLGAAMDPIRAQLDRGYTTFCIKPAQHIYSAGEMPGFLAEVMRRAGAMAQ